MGREVMLVFTLVMMWASTALIGLLPTYAQIGVWAPILLMVLRILQGFSAGGEWGGAALMAVEPAPREKRGFWGAYPEIGVPVGMILATLVQFLLLLNFFQVEYTLDGDTWPMHRTGFLSNHLAARLGHRQWLGWLH